MLNGSFFGSSYPDWIRGFVPLLRGKCPSVVMGRPGYRGEMLIRLVSADTVRLFMSEVFPEAVWPFIEWNVLGGHPFDYAEDEYRVPRLLVPAGSLDDD